MNVSHWKSIWNYGWRIGLTVALLWVVLREVDLVVLWQRVADTNWLILVGFIVMEVMLSWLAGWRWALLAVKQPSWQDIRDFYTATMLGQFYNLFMPSSMGGDLIKWTSLTHLQISKSKLVFTVLLDRLMGMFGLISWGFIGVMIAKIWHVASVPDVVMWLFGGLFIGMLGLFGFIYSPVQFADIPLLRRITVLLRIESYLAAHKQAFLQSFGLGLVIQVVWLVILYILAIEVGFSIGVWQFMVLQPVVSAVTALPISFAGFGATEAGFLYFYQQLGESPTTIITLTTLLGVCRIGIGLLGWLTGMLHKNR